MLTSIQKIDFAGSTLSIRRDSIACVADSKSYALLDVERQLKIPLMSISSLDESPSAGEIGQAQSLSAEQGGGLSRSSSSTQNRPSSSAQGHSRSASLGGSILNNIRRDEARAEQAEETTLSLPVSSSSPRQSEDGTSKPLPAIPSRTSTPNQAAASESTTAPVFLRPHIASPTPEEFLVIRGTSTVEPCIGMFVNLDGDPTRATLNFDRYPKDIAVDGGSPDLSSPNTVPHDEQEGFVLASMAKDFKDGAGLRHGLEIQPFDAGNSAEPERYWLEAAGVDQSSVYGLRSLVGSEELEFGDIIKKLSQKRFTPFSSGVDTPTRALKSSDSRTALSMERLSKEKELFEQNFDSQDEESLPDGWEATRKTEGEDFVRRLAKTSTKLVVWTGARIWWAIRNPLIVQYDSRLDEASRGGYANPQKIDRPAIMETIASIRGRDARTELEFLTLGYLRQKAGLLLLTSLLRAGERDTFSDSEAQYLEKVLTESSLDPRVVISLVPGVRNEIIEGRRGIWMHGGVEATATAFIRNTEFQKTGKGGIASVDKKILHFLRRFLTSWRGMKGLPSVSDESEVFKTVDAALLLVLLELDKHSPPGLGKGGAVRTELNDLVDKGVECFERAVDLLESHHRLFILSRLYQSRKMSGDVLATWKRIIEGERDNGQEFKDGEQRVREYLTKIRSQPLVQEYGVWLANRNPKLGVQVFAEDKGRAPKFEPTQVVEMLKQEAPDAVKYYLEHLVFGKRHMFYVKDLINYYLDVVVNELQSSEASRDVFKATYDAYRALRVPKPTYRHFLQDNAPADDDVSHSRLRLLQLLSGAHDYDAETVRDRISSLPQDLLVPENIILSGRDERHEEALKLLVHNLGDYDAAVSYCLRGRLIMDSTGGGLGRSDALPTADTQRRLFNAVLREFLCLKDASDRVEQTGALLERFGGWFEVDEVLSLIPDNWSVDVVGGFLIGALRRIVIEKRETAVTKALSGAENLRVSYDLVKSVDEKGPSIEAQN